MIKPGTCWLSVESFKTEVWIAKLLNLYKTIISYYYDINMINHIAMISSFQVHRSPDHSPILYSEKGTTKLPMDSDRGVF